MLANRHISKLIFEADSFSALQYRYRVDAGPEVAEEMDRSAMFKLNSRNFLKSSVNFQEFKKARFGEIRCNCCETVIS